MAQDNIPQKSPIDGVQIEIDGDISSTRLGYGYKTLLAIALTLPTIGPAWDFITTRLDRLYPSGGKYAAAVNPPEPVSWADQFRLVGHGEIEGLDALLSGDSPDGITSPQNFYRVQFPVIEGIDYGSIENHMKDDPILRKLLVQYHIEDALLPVRDTQGTIHAYQLSAAQASLDTEPLDDPAYQRSFELAVFITHRLLHLGLIPQGYMVTVVPPDELKDHMPTLPESNF